MQTTQRSDHDPLVDLIMDWLISGQKRTTLGKTKADEALVTGELAGIREGVAMGVSHLITMHRLKNFPRSETIQVMPPYEVIRDILKPAVIAKEDILGDPNAYASLHQDKRTNLLESLIEWVERQCEQFCRPEEWVVEEEELHRKAVLAGEEEPTKADEKWLNEELTRQEQKTNKIAQLLDATEGA